MVLSHRVRDGATLRVSSTLPFVLGEAGTGDGRAGCGGKAKGKGIAQLADFRFAAAVERRLSVELRNARGVARLAIARPC